MRPSRDALAAIAAAMLFTVVTTVGLGQGQRQGGAAPGGNAAPPPPPPTPQAAAPVDLTGYWVAIVTEDWRWRMVTPAKGDYASVPINFEAKKIADTWDPAKDDASGQQCKAYGAAGVMRLPGRLRIAWQDGTTLKVDTDAGQQTRLLHFGDWKSPGGRPTWQGDSVAEWEVPAGRRAGGAPTFGPRQTPATPAPADAPKWGNLKTVTTRMRPGYLRKNGVPYSDKATLTEYWDVLPQRNGDQWLVITTIVDDPVYLQNPWITSLNFKKEPDGSKWDPAPCSTR